MKDNKSTGKSTRKSTGKKRFPLSLFLFLALFFLILAFVFLRLGLIGTSNAESSSDPVRSIADSTNVMKYAKAVKNDLSLLVGAIKESDVSGMDQYYTQFDSDITTLKKELSSPLYSLAELTPKVGKEVKTARELVDIAETASNALLRPLVDTMKAYPLSALKAEGGINVRVATEYMNFLEQNIGGIESLTQQLEELDLSTLDSSGSFSGYVEKLRSLTQLYNDYRDYFPAAKAILGEGGDRLYVFAAQNSAEIRASGGFPGSVGTLRIRDGILTISDFKSVYSVFTQQVPYQAGITNHEIELFTERMYTTWDVDFCPDFERVAYIWALSYEQRNGESVNGVISAMPPVIQRLLSLCDPITLSDGTVINSENATRILQHDLYFQYVNASQQNIPVASKEMDSLFSEAANGTMTQLIANFNASNLSEYISVLDSCVKERLLMIWMKDETEETLMRQVGWSGSLNFDANDPKLGIYFSSETSGKMGWYLDIEPVIGEPVVNEDGSRSYDVHITLNNVIDDQDLRTGGTYILGRSYTGSVMGDLIICAPCGGTVSDMQINWTRGFKQTSYQGLETHTLHWLIISQNSPINITCTVTTAPGVETPLGLLVTPTLTAYRGTADEATGS